ncbi:thymidine kinase [Ureaplasma canigenitalium]|uniref:thymidine kinase n=1 Tax=Ureaplasma canigenitalium TaxID=42092 RepID=UPI0004E25050|nr:thymidine kinase [Ureaplasma canigenitalium]
MAKKHAFFPELGSIHLIVGPMFAGKTTEMIRRLERFDYADVGYYVFKPKIDTRTCDQILSRNGKSMKSIEITEPFEILDYIMNHDPKQIVRVIAVDEAQFFNDNLIEVANLLAENNYVVLISGLDKDFRGESFGPMSGLMTYADQITKLSAVCTECGADATYSLRKVNNKNADYNDQLVMIGCQEKYLAVCRHHHKVPNRPYRVKNSREFIKFNKANKGN